MEFFKCDLSKYSWAAAPLLNLLLMLLFGLGLLFFVCFFEHYLQYSHLCKCTTKKEKEGIDKLMFLVIVLCWGM